MWQLAVTAIGMRVAPRTRKTKNTLMTSFFEPRRRETRRRPAIVALCLIPTLASGCTPEKMPNKDGKDTESNQTAERICGSSLTTDASRYIRTISKGQPLKEAEQSSLGKIAKKLSRADQSFTTCRVYSGEEARTLAFEITVEREDRVPTRKNFNDDATTDWTIYPIGEHARVSWESATFANIYFSCAEKFTKPAPHIIHSTMTLFGTTRHDQRSGPAAISVLNSVSRGLAHELGCGSAAHLPENAPKPSAHWTAG